MNIESAAVHPDQQAYIDSLFNVRPESIIHDRRFQAGAVVAVIAALSAGIAHQELSGSAQPFEAAPAKTHALSPPAEPLPSKHHITLPKTTTEHGGVSSASRQPAARPNMPVSSSLP